MTGEQSKMQEKHVGSAEKSLTLKTFSLDILSKHRNALFGIAILWIMLFHGYIFGSYLGGWGKDNPINAFIRFGNVGVDIFLLLSGMGLYFSFAKRQDVYPFLKRRLSRVLPSVLIISGAFWLIFYVIRSGDIAGFLQRITLLRFWLRGDTNIWYVSFILVAYFIYPYLYHYLFDKGKALVRCGVAIAGIIVLNMIVMYVYPSFYNNVEIALTRFPVFIFGCYFGKLVYEKKRISIWWALPLVGGALAFWFLDARGVIGGPISRYLMGVAGVCFALTFALLLELLGKSVIAKALSKFFDFFGWMSLELYLAHLALRALYIEYIAGSVENGRLSQYLLVILAASIISAAVRLLLDKISLYHKRRLQHT